MAKQRTISVKRKRKVTIFLGILLLAFLSLALYINNTPAQGFTLNFPYGSKMAQLNIYHGVNIFIPREDNQILYIHNFSYQIESAWMLPPTPQPEAITKSPEPYEYSNSYITQRVQDFSFEYPSDWIGGVEGNYSYVPLFSSDYSAGNKGHESTGISISAEERNNSKSESLDQLRDRLLQENPGADVTKKEIAGLESIKLMYKAANASVSPTGNYILLDAAYMIYNDKIISLRCSFITSRAPINSETICDNIINSMTLI
jgi:hypothetical protein